MQPNPLTWTTLPNMSAERFFALIARIQKRTERGQADDCWPSSYSLETSGYPQLTVRGQKFRLHRVVHLLFNSELTTGQIVRHRCGNPLCVNPEHLTKGSYLDNSHDEIRYRQQQDGRIPPDDDYYLRQSHAWDVFWSEYLPDQED